MAIAKGYHLIITLPNRIENAATHVFCGRHSIVGAECPNCNKPLLRFFSFDMRDKRIPVQSRSQYIHLLYCWTCELSQMPFSYQVMEDSMVTLLAFNSGKSYQDFPYPSYPLNFPERHVGLIEISDMDQQVIIDLNDDVVDEWVIQKERPDLCMPRHQLGGTPYLVNAPQIPVCAICKNKMNFFSTVSDKTDWDRGFVENNYVQVVYYYCDVCNSLTALNLAD
ncbi:MAG: hypothetical protein HY080_02495 [Gammaproteobacteria bacterium]|nr:hypothetical protein [Gammaproteobacteria bacterium]